MEIVLIISNFMLAIGLAVAVGTALNWRATNTLLRRWIKEGSHRERRLRREMKLQQQKIDLMSTELLKRAGIHLVAPLTHTPKTQNDDSKPSPRRVVSSPSEVIARQKKIDAGMTPFLTEASKLQAGAENAPSRNGASVG